MFGGKVYFYVDFFSYLNALITDIYLHSSGKQVHYKCVAWYDSWSGNSVLGLQMPTAILLCSYIMRVSGTGDKIDKIDSEKHAQRHS